MTNRKQPTLTIPTEDAQASTSQGSITFIGNATVLIRYAGFTILTDPNFIHAHEQVPVGYGLHATRLKDPAMDIGDLPPLDLVLLSHFHGDHFDQVAERDLDKALPIMTNPQAARELRHRGFAAAHPLQTWEPFLSDKGNTRLRITATPGWHGPAIVGALLPDVMGSIVEFEEAGNTLVRIYISGDTLVIDDLKEIPARYPNIDLALLHLGGTQVLGIMVTMDGKQGVELLQIVNPQRAIPIHYDDYDLFKSPLSDFQEEVRAAGLESKVQYLERGGTFTFP
ncbi:MAG: MBL fold metallo-hydrolase [Chloroflexia bacterium]